MIDDPPLLAIRRNFKRPDPAIVAALAGTPSGFLVDAMDGRGALDARIKPVTEANSFCGVAVTCFAGPGDVLAVFGALTVVEAGDVVVCATDAFTGTAVIGDLLVGMLKNAGAGAFVTDGLVRDVAGVRAVGLPCYGAGVTPNSPAKTGPGTVGMDIVAGGVAVASGDIVVGDPDGVVVIPQGQIAAVMQRLPAIRAAEASLEKKVKAGMIMPDFIQGLIDQGRFKEVD